MSAAILTPARQLPHGVAIVGLLGAFLQILGGALEVVNRVLPGEPGFATRTAIIGLAYLMLLVAVVGLAMTGAAGSGITARLGIGLACLGWALSVVSQFVLSVNLDLAENVLFPVATIATGTGMVLAGIGVLRTRCWSGWHRFIPLLCGLYPFAVTFPVFAATGAPNFVVFSGWGVCWFALAAAMWRQRSTSASVTGPAETTSR